MHKEHNDITAAFGFKTGTITLLDNVQLSGTGLITGEYPLTDSERGMLIGATQNVNGQCILEVTATGVSGSGTPVPTLTLTGLEYTVDDTNWATWHPLPSIVVSGTGITGQVAVTSAINPNTTSIKLNAGAQLLTSGDFIYVTATLKLVYAHG